MREIKFRAWNRVGKYYVNNVQDAYDGAGPNGPFDSFGDALDDDNYVVEQFTGLTDVNGKEIYEGDIVVSKSNEPKFEPLKIGVVKRSKARAGWCYATATATGEYTIWISGKYRTYEVIGNVHENPELLEAEK